MAAKKKAEEVPLQRVLLGRPSNSLKLGIVGMPNVGKSTLFNILTKMAVPAENYPFCTIDPSEARVVVPDERYEWLIDHWKPASKVAAILTCTDIAGLIRGASQGEGLGNAFLSHIKAVDGIMHVIRVFEDTDVTHVEGNVEPVRDLDIICEELVLKDIELCDKLIDSLDRHLRHTKDKVKTTELEVLKKVKEVLALKKQIRLCEWKSVEVEVLNSHQFLTAKPVLYVVNMSEKDYAKKGNKFLPKIKQWIDAHGGEPMVPFCGTFENKLGEMGEESLKQYCAENKVTSGIPKIIKTGYHTLELIHFFTCGTDEVKCWTIRKGTKAPQAAGVIHTDFERGFICAEVMKFEDYKEHGSEGAVKSAGKLKQEGKNYVVCDGDIIFFKFNVTTK